MTETPLKCEVCEQDASFMCTNRRCLRTFCNICPHCPLPDLCNDEKHLLACWNSHIPSFGKNRAMHERGALDDRNFLSEVLYCEGDPARQKMLHQEDRKSLWFIIEPGEEAILEDTGPTQTGSLYVTNRLNSILTNAPPLKNSAPDNSPPGNTSPKDRPQTRFPTLVSFVGETGTGKSTLIRALIKESRLAMAAGQNQQTPIEAPVPQASATQTITHPTSSGVHLYQDPKSSITSRPILFADCEGFNAGGISAASFPQDLVNDPNIAAKFKLTAHSYTTSTEHEDLYAKSLYSFSDCVCFVIKNAQTMAKSLEKLLVWAAKGSGTVHRLPQKSLILILNPQSPHREELMDQRNLKAVFLGEEMTFWKDNRFLNTIQRAAFRNTPVTAVKFLSLYFSSITAIYIPDGNRADVHPADVRHQIRALYEGIEYTVNQIADIRKQTWTAYNEKDFTRLFHLAVQHFAASDTAFNFFEAAKSTSLDHRGLEGHVLALRRQFTGAAVVDRRSRFPSIVASALVNKVLREDPPSFNTDLQWKKCHQACEKAIDRFYKQYLVCEFMEKGKPCIKTFHLHGLSHNDKDGNIIQNGDFHPNKTEIHRQIAQEVEEIRDSFFAQYVKALQHQGRSRDYPSQDRLVQKRREILRGTYHSTCPCYSYRTCFSCLHAAPDHVLPCGHAFCETCVIDFGKPVDGHPGAYMIGECIFDGEKWTGEQAQIIQIKPHGAGCRILTLDGGGVRGILELEMLNLLSDMIGLDLHISHFFDLIVGTSTGGLVALGVGVEELELSDMKKKFTKLASETFRAVRGKKTISLGTFAIISAAVIDLPAAVMVGGLGLVAGWAMNMVYKQSIYKTEPLKYGIQQLLGTETSMFGSPRRKKKQRSTRVAVMCMKDPTKVSAIANYNRPVNNLLLDGSDPHQGSGSIDIGVDEFERAEDEEEELKCWEAALATSAAPPYFQPFTKERSKTVYFDGGLEHNNPIFWAAEEYRRIWKRPESEAKLDLIVSIGTGIVSEIKRDENIPAAPVDYNPVMALLASTTHRLKGKKIWEDFTRREAQYSAVSHRLDLDLGGIRCNLDDYQAMNDIVIAFNRAIVHQERIPRNQQLRDKINLVAHLLMAKLFFFEPTSPVMLVKNNHTSSMHSFQIQGKIMCRLPQGSKPLKELVSRIVCFAVAESGNEKDPHTRLTRSDIIIIDATNIKNVVRNGGKFEIGLTITSLNYLSIFIQLRHAAVIPPLKIGEEAKISEAGIAQPGTMEERLSGAIALQHISDKLAISGFPCRISDLTKRTPAHDT